MIFSWSRDFIAFSSLLRSFFVLGYFSLNKTCFAAQKLSFHLHRYTVAKPSDDKTLHNDRHCRRSSLPPFRRYCLSTETSKAETFFLTKRANCVTLVGREQKMPTVAALPLITFPQEGERMLTMLLRSMMNNFEVLVLISSVWEYFSGKLQVGRFLFKE